MRLGMRAPMARKKKKNRTLCNGRWVKMDTSEITSLLWRMLNSRVKLKKGFLGEHNWNVELEGHELHRARAGVHGYFSLFSLCFAYICVPPLPCWIHCWYVNNGKHILRPDNPPNTQCGTWIHTVVHTSSASAAPEECFFHRWCEENLVLS